MKKASQPPPPHLQNTKKPTLFQDFSSHFFSTRQKNPKKQNKAKQRENENKTTPYLKIKCLS